MARETMHDKDILNRLPPQNIEAEMAVLGSMLIEDLAIGTALEILKNKDYFYRDTHRKIFSAIMNLYSENRAVDLVTLNDQMAKDGTIDSIEGGAAYLASLAGSVPTAANVAHYARIVKEKYLLRNLINVSTQIVTDSFDASRDVEEILDKAESMIFDIAGCKVETDFVSIKDVIKANIETIDRLYQRKEHVTGVATGFHDIDMQTAGLQPSDLIIIGGRPSMGKSALMCSIAEHVSVGLKIPVVIFSLEMSKEQLGQRMLCSHARVDAHKVRTGFLSQTDWPKLTTAAGKLSEAQIFIDDTPGISVMELRAKSRRLKSRHDIGLVILDYLQLMQGTSRSENRQQEISEISRSLKALARELHVPVIAISQLSRAVETRGESNRPKLSDLRESGAIEQDADLVILLLREEYYNPTEENKGKAEVMIAKQRNGPTGSVELAFIKEYTRFENLAKVEREF